MKEVLAKYQALRREMVWGGEEIDWESLGMAKPEKPSAPPASILFHRIDNKTFDKHIRWYLMNRNYDSCLELHRAIWMCRGALQDKLVGGHQFGPSLIECEEKFLKWLIMEVADLPSFGNPKQPQVGELIPEFIPYLPDFRTIMSFGCMDITTFAGNAAPGFFCVASNRTWAVSDTIGPQPCARGLSEKRLRLDLEMVMRNRSAECLGFALAAAGCLLKGGFRGKLSVVSNGTHKFLIYDRAQFLYDRAQLLVPYSLGTLGQSPARPTRGPQRFQEQTKVIIDLWLGSVGQQWCWLERAWPEYPFSRTNLTTKLELDQFFRVPAVELPEDA